MIIQKSLAYLIARSTPGLINLLTISTYTRLLSPEIYGQYTFSLAFIMLAMTLAFQWLQHGLLRYYHQQSISPTTLLSTIAFAFLLLSVTLLPVFLMLIQLFQTQFSFTILAYIFALAMILSFFNINLQIPVSQGSSMTYGLLSSVKAILGLAFGLLFIHLGYGLHGLFLALILANGLPIIWSIQKYWMQLSWRLIDIQLLKSLFYFGAPLSSTLIMNMLINNSDRIMLSWLKDNSQTGLYSAVYDLANLSMIIFMMSVNLALYPLLLKAYEQKQRDMTQHLLSKTAIALALIAIPLLLVFIVFPQQLSVLLLGQEFREAGSNIIPIIGLATFIWGFKAYYYDIPFLLKHKTLALLVISAIGCCANIALNYLLIPPYGIYGAAYATLISNILIIFLAMFWSRRIYRLPQQSTELLKVAFMTVIIAAVLVLLRHYFTIHIIFNGLLIVILFTLGVYSFNFLEFRQQVQTYIKEYRDRQNS